ncbi:MAG: sensor domain-containing diguanylate cyclase [Planctomycetota bacterium]|jgi:diguanylate cyclase (GGDEF)-like protein/PAS domain S-box-containing protein
MAKKNGQVESRLTDFHRELLDSLYDGVYFLDPDRKITYWSRAAERLTGYGRSEVLGKRCADNLLMHVDGQGRSLCADNCPVKETLENGQPCEANAFFRHKKGHRVPVSIRATPVRDHEGNVVGAVEIFRDESRDEEIFRRVEELERMALVDQQTGLANRRHCEAHLRMRLEELSRYDWPVGVLFIDIDHFKRVNDNYGHDVGDDVLRVVARSLINSMRPFDFLGRWGGEEFLGVVVNVEEAQLNEIAERCRLLVEASGVPSASGAIPVTVSVGATLAATGEELETVVKRADELMYRAKEAGRNRVEIG